MFRDWKTFGFHAIKAVCGIVMFISGVFIFYTVGPSIETRFFPVVSKLQILSIKAVDADHTEIRAGFRKLRNCEYLGIAWYVGTRPDDIERVAVAVMRDRNDTSDPNRPVGYHKAGPWIVTLPLDDVEKRSFAQLAHRCHPFWTTITEFYP